MKTLCGYCGSNAGNNPAYADAARALGARMAADGIALVYGGGNVGLMGIVADAVLQAGGEVVGVIPEQLVNWEVAHKGVTRLEVVGSMHERKMRMFDLSDGFVALPGGFGTLDEMFEMLTWRQLGIGDKPCAFLDVDGFYAPLIGMIDRMVEERDTLRDSIGNLLDSCSTLRQVLEKWPTALDFMSDEVKAKHAEKVSPTKKETKVISEVDDQAKMLLMKARMLNGV